MPLREEEGFCAKREAIGKARRRRMPARIG
jgi:hypothetical protein